MRNTAWMHSLQNEWPHLVSTCSLYGSRQTEHATSLCSRLIAGIISEEGFSEEGFDQVGTIDSVMSPSVPRMLKEKEGKRLHTQRIADEALGNNETPRCGNETPKLSFHAM